MRSLAPVFRLVKGALLVTLVIALAACARGTGPGVGNAGPGNATPGTQQDFLVSVGDRVFFDTDSSVLSQQAQHTLDLQAVWLQRYPQYKITIEGHADERGTREYNFALGARRAATVKNYLISKGVDASRISTISYGKERPVAICNNMSCWSQNRRAVTVLK